MYIENLPSDVEDLRTALKNNDWGILKTKAHSLKPKFGYIGLNMASEYTKQIEKLATDKEKIGEITDLVQKISEEWDYAFREIKIYVKNN